MTVNKMQEIANNKILNGVFNELSKLPDDEQLRAATMVQGFLIASEHFANKNNKASA